MAAKSSTVHGAGRDRKQFEALGFQPNDVVTGVNGIELTDPGKAMELYRVMREANEASFDVLRNGEQLNLVVQLQATDTGTPQPQTPASRRRPAQGPEDG